MCTIMTGYHLTDFNSTKNLRKIAVIIVHIAFSNIVQACKYRILKVANILRVSIQHINVLK